MVNSKYYRMTSMAVKDEAIKFLSECDDAGFSVIDAINYLQLENRDLYDALIQFQISIADCWRSMRVKKIDGEG